MARRTPDRPAPRLAGRRPTRVGGSGQSGVTLIEVLVAFTIMAVIVGVLVAGLRVGVRAWEAGDRRVAIQQEIRAVIELLTEALSTAAPYRDRIGTSPDRVVLFQGETDELRFVTTSAPLVLDAPAAPFHAVTLLRSRDDQLHLVERLVPAEEPFGDKPYAVLARSVTALKLEYRDAEGVWSDRWDGRDAGGLPTAVRVGLTVRDPGRGERASSFVVSLVLGKTS
jgi:general secretion pathway protein J